MKTITEILIVSLMCFATSCHDYSKSLTKDKEITSDLVLENVKPDRTYVIKLKTGLEYKVRVKRVDRDSLSGSFSMVYPRVRHSPKIETAISLQGIKVLKLTESTCDEPVFKWCLQRYI